MDPNQVDGVFYSDEKAAEIAANFSYDGYQVVRREMFAHLACPAVTIRKDSVTFNTACINGLEDAVYIQIFMSRNQKRMVIKKSSESVKDSLRWCVNRNDKRKTRTITSREFSGMVYQMMAWDDSCRYKIAGHKIQYQGETLYVFELSEPEIFRELPKRTKEEKEELEKRLSPEELKELQRKEMKESRTPFYPKDIQNTFGVPVSEHEDHPTLGDPVQYTGMSAFSKEESETQGEQMTLDALTMQGGDSDGQY